MASLSTHVRRWWLGFRQPPGPQVPYELTCVCGRVALGLRKERHQAVPCAGCGHTLFVLPFSRLPRVLADGEVADADSSFWRHSPWRFPLAAGGLTLLVLVLALSLLLGSSVRKKRSALAVRPGSVAQHLEAGQRALSQGKFQVAFEEAKKAEKIRADFPDTVSLAERRQVTHLYRQAALFTDLLPESLNEILRHAADLAELDDVEWQEHFKGRYANRSLIFDDEVRREAAGGYQLLGSAFFVRGKPVRLDLANVQLLHALPLDKPQRVLFGVRLHSIALEPGGVWVVRFEPDSGVLLTEAGPVLTCCPIPRAELLEAMQRQAAWFEDLP